MSEELKLPTYARLRDVDGLPTNEIIKVISKKNNEGDYIVKTVLYVLGEQLYLGDDRNLNEKYFTTTDEFNTEEGIKYLKEILEQAKDVRPMMIVPGGGARKSRKAKKTRKSKKARKSKKTQKTRKH
jgi:hypothetical protein